MLGVIGQTWLLGSAPVKNHGLVLDCHIPVFQSSVSRSHVNRSPVGGELFSTDTSIGSREALNRPLKASKLDVKANFFKVLKIRRRLFVVARGPTLPRHFRQFPPLSPHFLSRLLSIPPLKSFLAQLCLYRSIFEKESLYSSLFYRYGSLTQECA